MAKKQQRELSWTFSRVWNDSLISVNNPSKARDYIYASEIGGAFIDRFLKMKGVPFTNPANDRSLRKFQAGNIWEWVVLYVLKRAGLLIETQRRIEHQYKGLLRVSGRQDFIAGGVPNYDEALKYIDEMCLPEALDNAAKNVVSEFKKLYADTPLKHIILEVKSASSFMFEKILSQNSAEINHICQTFHYIKGTKINEGHIVYICKDDCRLFEHIITNERKYESIYKADIEKMTDYYNSDTQPPKEQMILFDEIGNRFYKNWRVEYSPYLTLIYGFETPEDFRNATASKAMNFNRVLARCLNGDKMTDKNLDVISEATKLGFDWDKIVQHSKISI